MQEVARLSLPSFIDRLSLLSVLTCRLACISLLKHAVNLWSSASHRQQEQRNFCSSACSKGKFQQLSFAPSAVAKEIFCSSASSKGKFQRLSFAPSAVAKETFCSSACSKGKFQQLSFACNCNQLELIVVCGYVACAQHVVYRRSKLYGFEMEAKARGSSCPRDGGACG